MTIYDANKFDDEYEAASNCHPVLENNETDLRTIIEYISYLENRIESLEQFQRGVESATRYLRSTGR